jgi:hypothetical protein
MKKNHLSGFNDFVITMLLIVVFWTMFFSLIVSRHANVLEIIGISETASEGQINEKLH